MEERKAYNFFISTAVIQLAKQLKGKLDHTNFTYDVEYKVDDDVYYLYKVVDGKPVDPIALELYIPVLLTTNQQLIDKSINEIKKIITKL